MIISASRRTDIPAFYSQWFMNRIIDNYVLVRNPMNIHCVSKIVLSPENVDCIVFWTKNPKNMLDKISLLDKYNYKYYFQFTITSYDSNIEVNIPRKSNIIDIFIKLSNLIGKERVIWRYDPILITDEIDADYHFKYYEFIAKKLSGYTDKCVFSFIDLYKKCQSNLKNIKLKEIDNNEKLKIAIKLSDIANKYKLEIESCAEDIDLGNIGIPHGKCIDDNLISKILGREINYKKDKSQREVCGCIESIDIGAYNTCNHNCLYCYANFNKKLVERNIKRHDVKSPLIYGNIDERDKIVGKKINSCLRAEKRLFE